MKGENQRAHIDFKRQPHKMVNHTQIIHKSIDLLKKSRSSHRWCFMKKFRNIRRKAPVLKSFLQASGVQLY